VTASTTPARILVVDDEASLADLVAAVLRYEGFTVTTVASGEAAVVAVRAERPDLMLLDIQLPGIDGFEVQARLNAERLTTPTVFLTARDGGADKVRGLTLGGDDYVTKPFNIDELIARVRAVLRRSGHQSARSSLLTFADLTLDEETREVKRADRRIELTPTEFNLLHYLMVNAPRVLTKVQILDHVWRYDFDGETSIVETYIFYLRKKVDQELPPLIHTVRGVGYCLRVEARS
jgi:two-component system, OmpR family, response regulator